MLKQTFVSFSLVFLLSAFCTHSSVAETDSTWFVDTKIVIDNASPMHFEPVAPIKDESWDGYAFLAFNDKRHRVGIVRLDKDLNGYNWRFLDGVLLDTASVVVDLNGDGFQDISGNRYMLFQDANGTFQSRFVQHERIDFQYDWNHDGHLDNAYTIHGSWIRFLSYLSASDTIVEFEYQVSGISSNHSEVVSIVPNFCGIHAVVVANLDPKYTWEDRVISLEFFDLNTGQSRAILELDGTYRPRNIVVTNYNRDTLSEILVEYDGIIFNEGYVRDVEIQEIEFPFDPFSTMLGIIRTLPHSRSPWDISNTRRNSGLLYSVDSAYNFSSIPLSESAHILQRATTLDPEGTIFVSEFAVDEDSDKLIVHELRRIESVKYDSLTARFPSTLTLGDTLTLHGPSWLLKEFSVNEVTLRSELSGFLGSPFHEVSRTHNTIRFVCDVLPIAGEELELVIRSKLIGQDIGVIGFRRELQGASISGDAGEWFRPRFSIDSAFDKDLLKTRHLTSDVYPDLIVSTEKDYLFLKNSMSTGENVIEFERLKRKFYSQPAIMIEDFDNDGDLEFLGLDGTTTNSRPLYDRLDDVKHDIPSCLVSLDENEERWASENHFSTDLNTDGMLDILGTTDVSQAVIDSTGCTNRLQDGGFTERSLPVVDLNNNGMYERVDVHPDDKIYGYNIVESSTFSPRDTVFLERNLVGNFETYYSSNCYGFDANGDGIGDLLIGHNASTGQFAFIVSSVDSEYSIQTYSANGGIIPLGICDINGDRRLDLVVHNTSELSYYPGGSDFGNTPAVPMRLIGEHNLDERMLFSSFKPTDFDLDGDVDFFLFEYGNDRYSDKWYFYSNHNTGTPVSVEATSMPNSCLDFNYDSQVLKSTCGEMIGRVIVSDQIGRTVYTSTISSPWFATSAMNLPNGIYYVRNGTNFVKILLR